MSWFGANDGNEDEMMEHTLESMHKKRFSKLNVVWWLISRDMLDEVNEVTQRCFWSCISDFSGISQLIS